MAGIEIRGLTRHFRGGTRALEGVDLEVAQGELMALVGPSGSGKTTLLRLVAGLDQPTAGSIRLGGQALAGVPPHQRNVAVVFQNFALYSHLTVAENLAFGLNHEGRTESRKPTGKREIVAGVLQQEERVRSVVEMLDLNHLLFRCPSELSGGEQQRVALGRAIVRRPAALLLDEPLSSLDAPVRRGLRRELKALQRQLGVPTIYVTHDQAEALALGDRVAVLDHGLLQQVGPPNEVYHRPANRFVAEFFGPQGMNMTQAKLTHSGDSPSISIDGWNIRMPDEPRDLADRVLSNQVLCGFRAEDLLAGRGDLSATVIDTETSGAATYVHVRLPASGDQPQQCVFALAPDDLAPPQPGAEIRLTLDTNRLHLFDPTTGNRL